MKIFALFGKSERKKSSPPAEPLGAPSQLMPASQFMGQSQLSRNAGTSTSGTRRELLRVVLRDTLKRHGIPQEWITADMLTATSRTRESGIQWRLCIRHWDARLPALCVALQNALITRVQMFDPMAEQWLMGVTWQFSVADESACPELPAPSSWAMPAPVVPAAVPVAQAALVDLIDGPSGDVIAGPAALAAAAVDAAPSDVKADLEKLMAAFDAQYEAMDAAAKPGTYAQTQPAGL
jgi:hypothetical protein